MTSVEKFRVALADCLSLGLSALGKPIAAIGLLAAVSFLEPGCVTDYASSDPAFPGDFQARHPIALASAPALMDIYPVGGTLDPRTVANLRSFVRRYRDFGSGEVLILTPAHDTSHARTVSEIRRALRAAGLRAPVGAKSYVPYQSDGAAPFRVAFTSLVAEVKTPCGLWPQDLASGSSLEGWKNEPYANFGCATQSVIAAQVDDPRDFVQPRALGLSDVAMRTRAIQDVRKGEDPSTSWSTGLTPIGGGVQ